MPFQQSSGGLQSAAEFIVSPLPWLTASTVFAGSSSVVDFPYVTSYLSVRNMSPTGTLYLGFTRGGLLGSNRISLQPSQSFSGDYRVKSVHLMGSGPQAYEVLAGLTSIKTSDYSFPLSGSGFDSMTVTDMLAIPSMSFWVDAADESTLYQDAALTTPVVAGADIAAWLDKSGNGVHLFQATASLRPWLIKDAYIPNAVRTTIAGSEWMGTNSNVTISPGEYTIFCAFRNDWTFGGSQKGLVRLASSRTSAAMSTDFLTYFQNGTGVVFAATENVTSGVQSVLSAHRVPSNKSCVMTLYGSSGSFPLIRTNGVNVVTTSFGTPNLPTSNPFWLSSGHSGAGANNGYHEILVFSRRLGVTEISSVESYLMGKWVNNEMELKIPSCSLYFDAYSEYGKAASTTDTSPAITSGAGVLFWADGAGYVTGTIHRFTQTVSAQTPKISFTGFGGRRSIMSVSASLSSMTSSMNFTSLAAGNSWSMFLAVDSPVISGSNASSSGHFNPSYVRETTGRFAVATSTNPTNAYQCYVNGSTGYGISAPATASVPAIIAFRCDGGKIYESVNGGTEVTASVGGTLPSVKTTLTLFSSFSTNTYLSGRLGEFVTYDRCLSQTETNQLVTYLKGKWGIS